MREDSVFESLESNVRAYCRVFPSVFEKAKGSLVWDTSGREYIDFFSGAGALNYGHNDEAMKAALIDYIKADGIIHSLDLYSTAKRKFLEDLSEKILSPRGLDYKCQFTGPTGTNAVEAAMKLARRVTGRHSIAAFTNGFHGMTLGSLAATANPDKRAAAGVPLPFIIRLPYDGFHFSGTESLDYIEKLLGEPGSGIDLPAAFLLETIQGEGGLAAASAEWLQGLAAIAKRFGILLIIDDIQAGCGRAGTFFSFEDFGIAPDIVCLSKSLSGFGLPLSLVLMAPELDIWQPGEHNGTFRGNNLAFVSASCAIARWVDPTFRDSIRSTADFVYRRLRWLCRQPGAGEPEIRGRGLFLGLKWSDPAVASRVSRSAFARNLLVETCGAEDDVLKLMPPMTIEQEVLEEGLTRLEMAVMDAAVHREPLEMVG